MRDYGICLFCGSPFSREVPEGARLALYCNRHCRKRAQDRRRKLAKVATACTTPEKRVYALYGEAVAALNGAGRGAHHPLYVYRCPGCRAYHLTSLPQKERAEP